MLVASLAVPVSRVRAVEQVLLRGVVEVSGLDGVGGLCGSSGGESPARSTSTLVLYWNHGVHVSPVNVGSGGGERGEDS